MKPVLFVICALFIGASSVFATPVITWEPRPDWVEPLDIPPMPETRRDQIDNGVFYAVNDVHLRWRGDERLAYSRLAMQVVTFSGLDKAATLTRNFEPAFETISLISVDILRDGARISLRDKLHPEIFRREKNLEDGIVDGELTLHVNLPGVQVGDIVDVEVLYHTKASVGALNHQYRRSLDWSEPEGITRMTVDWQKTRPFFSKMTAHGMTETTEDLGQWIRHRWQRRDGDPIFAEKNMPDEEAAWGVLALSEHADWGGIVKTLLPYYDRPHPVPESLLDDVEKIRKSGETAREKALRALFLVQDRIRYVGLEVGIGGYVARDPMVVASYQYGDCKDKAVLLKTLLDALQIGSNVVLVHSGKGAGLAQKLPSLYAFNHMIVRVNLPHGPLWVDPTRSFRGGAVSGFAPPDYHWGLPIAKGVTQLQEIPHSPLSAHIRKVHESFTFGPDGMQLKVTTKARGEEANWYRWKIATESRRRYARQLEGYYRGLYPGLKQAADLEFHDDRDHNTVEMKESYVLPDKALFKEDLIRAFGFKPDGFAAVYSPPHAGKRKFALKVKHAYRYEHVVSIKNPPIELAPPEDYTMNGAAFSFAYHGSKQPDGITLRWTLETHRADIPAAFFAQWKQDVARMEDKLYWEWDMTPPPEEAEAEGFFSLLQKAYEKANAQTE